MKNLNVILNCNSRNISYKKIVRILPCFVFILIGLKISAAEEVSTKKIDYSSNRLENPYLLPQTSFYFGNVNYIMNLATNNNPSIFNLESSGVNVYGLDLEVNHSKFMNIGAFLRAECLNRMDLPQDINFKFTTLMGGFSRFFYAPPFLRSRTMIPNIFLRLELGGGPIVMSVPAGLVAEGGAYIGIETYITRWFGVSMAYGKVFEYGKETLLSGLKSSIKYEGATFWNQGSVFAISLKSTFF